MQDDLVEVAGDRARQIGWLIVEDLGNTPESNSLTAFLNAASESTLARLERDILATRPQPTDEMVEKLKAALRPFVEEFEARRDAYIRRYPRNPGVGANNFDAMPDSWEMEGSKFSMGTFRAALAAMGEAR